MSVCIAKAGVSTAVCANVQDLPDALKIELPAPGVVSDGVAIHVENGVLTISAERKTGDAESKYLRRERPAGAVRKRFQIPVWVDAAKISANLSDGILTVSLPKADWAQRRTVPVN
ncbi:MAG: hypothetical protein AMXMBFR84_00790 [Candidatus Hydrogenedentota bacterium]